MKHLSVKELKVLAELDKDARQSASSIGKLVGVPKQTVHYIRNKLFEEGYVVGTYAVINTIALGYLHFNALLRLRTLSSRQNVLKHIRLRHGVVWLAECHGRWDVALSFLAKTVEEYDEFVSELLSIYGEDVSAHALSVLVSTITYSRTYLLGGSGVEYAYRSVARQEVDPLEHELLKLLSKDAGMALLEMARRLGISIDVIRHRMDRLKRSGVIQGFRASLDLEKLGRAYYRVMFDTGPITKEQEMALREHCKTNPDVVFFIKYVGPLPLQIEVEIEPQRLDLLIEDMRKAFPFIKTYEVLRLRERKLDYYPFA